MLPPLFGVFLICFWLFLCFLVGQEAQKYKRSASAWFLLALCFSPLVTFIFLLVADVPYNAILREEQEQRIRERHPERTDVRHIAANEMSCPKCGASVNPVTRDGLRSPDNEPWLLICNQCEAKIEP